MKAEKLAESVREEMGRSLFRVDKHSAPPLCSLFQSDTSDNLCHPFDLVGALFCHLAWLLAVDLVGTSPGQTEMDRARHCFPSAYISKERLRTICESS